MLALVDQALVALVREALDRAVVDRVPEVQTVLADNPRRFRQNDLDDRSEGCRQRLIAEINLTTARANP